MEYLINLVFYLGVIGIIFVLVYYPKKIEQKKLKEMQDNLKVGDNVTTYSGLCGVIEQVEHDHVVIKLKPDDVRIQIERWAVVEVN